MAETTYASNATVSVGGTELSDDLAAHIDQVVVDEDLHRPAMFAITLLDPDRDIVSRTGLKPGAEVEIGVEGDGASDDKPLVTGDVVTVECEYDDEGPRVLVRGYDASHRLHRGQRTRAYHDATDSDIVSQVVSEAGLDIDLIEATSEVHEHVAQANTSDWDFLGERAQPLGLDLTMQEGRVRFGPRPSADAAPPEPDPDADAAGLDPRQLVYGYNLIAFHGRLSAAEQVASVEVRGWDTVKKEPIVVSAPAGTSAAGLDATNPYALADAFGGQTFVNVATTIRSDREGDAVAKVLAEAIGSAFAEVEGTAQGNTALRAGTAVRISEVSREFNGAYVLSHVRHVFDGLGYRTHFNVSGHQDRSLLGLVAGGANAATPSTGSTSNRGRQRVTGLHRGLVSENADPENLGRVKVRFPWLDDGFSTRWAPVVQLGAGPDSGTFFLPAVDDEVLVGFEHGDMNLPLVIGGLFNGVDKPPPYGSYLDNGAVTGRSIVSRTGHEISLHDARDRAGIVIHVVDGERQSVVSIGLNALDEKLVVMSSKDIDVRADGNISVHGKQVSIEADGELVLKGATIKLN